MKDCTHCKKLWASIARFGGGTILFFLWVTMLAAWQTYRSQIGWWILPYSPIIPGLLAALIFSGSGLSILFAWMRKIAFAKVWIVFLVAAIATLMNGWVLMTTLGWWARPLFLLCFFSFGLAVHSPREHDLLRTTSGSCEKPKW